MPEKSANRAAEQHTFISNDQYSDPLNNTDFAQAHKRWLPFSTTEAGRKKPLSTCYTNQIDAYTRPKTVRTAKIKHIYLFDYAKTNKYNKIPHQQRAKNKKLIFLIYCDFQEKSRDIRRNYII
ncbi:hypothetical protein [Acetobacter sicerae]|uniref:hypothetical protein n=1 Tax=Acetobacter sicerae TaxID=85325 RepID=UPI00156ACEFE|nr:hypothetical protein [Acetobacter sicerae]NHN91576.1 hypothetical protein [Acetobacter sicerae]